MICTNTNHVNTLSTIKKEKKKKQTGQMIDLCCEYFWMVHLTRCYHVTYAFQSESALCSCLNVKELLSRNRRVILNLSDSKGIQTKLVK